VPVESADHDVPLGVVPEGSERLARLNIPPNTVPAVSMPRLRIAWNVIARPRWCRVIVGLLKDEIPKVGKIGE